MHAASSSIVQHKKGRRHEGLRPASTIKWIYVSSLVFFYGAKDVECFTTLRCRIIFASSRGLAVSLLGTATTTVEDGGISHLNTSPSPSISPAKTSPSNENQNLPKWLQGYSEYKTDKDVDSEVRWLEYKMLEKGIHMEDMRIIVTDIYKVAEGDATLSVGIVVFLTTILSLKDFDEGSFPFVSVPVLRASIQHYAECVNARRRGIPTLLKEFLKQPPTDILALPSAIRSREPFHSVSHGTPFDSALPSADTESAGQSQSIHSSLEIAVIISRAAARIKRAEMLVQAISKESRVSGTESENVRGLLLSVTEDWRALGIRVVACLYRLEGLLKSSDARSEHLERTPEVVRTAREALQVYAPLAQRIGLQGLKARIEGTAFRILYKRQYEAATSIFRDVGGAMNALSGYLLSHISRTLRSDERLMAELEDLQVVARVKEPYSFWRKLLKKRLKLDQPLVVRGAEEARSSSLVVPQVNDGVALRVILKAKRKRMDETDDVTRSREEVLCYYVQKLIRMQWPEIDSSRLKDYIAEPKRNGYQSLHHTSKISIKGAEFPFEVQVRSEDMHRLAEFGYAAHWDYKLGSKNLPPAENIAADETSFSEIRQNPSSHVDALVCAKEALRNHKVYVFIVGGEDTGVTGELVAVPVDSSIDSAIFETENTLPEKIKVWRNGKHADKSDTLENGDVVMVAL